MIVVQRPFTRNYELFLRRGCPCERLKVLRTVLLPDDGWVTEFSRPWKRIFRRYLESQAKAAEKTARQGCLNRQDKTRYHTSLPRGIAFFSMTGQPCKLILIRRVGKLVKSTSRNQRMAPFTAITNNLEHDNGLSPAQTEIDWLGDVPQVGISHSIQFLSTFQQQCSFCYETFQKLPRP